MWKHATNTGQFRGKVCFVKRTGMVEWSESSERPMQHMVLRTETDLERCEARLDAFAGALGISQQWEKVKGELYCIFRLYSLCRATTFKLGCELRALSHPRSFPGLVTDAHTTDEENVDKSALVRGEKHTLEALLRNCKYE
ncbi:MAG: hypothetical protein M1826_001185 [Phylliscum demangeonii]|nr:MAG: hypothetical protein M1826_001185 [Phylliscum demangeonii]